MSSRSYRRREFHELTDTGRAILHAISRCGSDIEAIRYQLTGTSSHHRPFHNTLTRELRVLQSAGFIELNPLRMTHAGFEVVRGYR